MYCAFFVMYYALFVIHYALFVYLTLETPTNQRFKDPKVIQSITKYTTT